MHADFPCERNVVTVLPDHRKVILEIMHAASDGILLSELPNKFEASIYCWFSLNTHTVQCAFIPHFVEEKVQRTADCREWLIVKPVKPVSMVITKYVESKDDDADGV